MATKEGRELVLYRVQVLTGNCTSKGWGCSSVGRASGWHAADAGLIPQCGKGFFSQGQLSVKALLTCAHTPPCAIACIYICAHVKDPVVHVRVWWIMETLKHPACTIHGVKVPLYK